MSLEFYKPDFSKKIWLTSDIHGYHKNLTSGVSSWPDKVTSCRQFDDQFVMTETVVNNINSVVGEDDILYSLGDWSFGGYDNIKKLRDMIKCKTIIHLLGNHCGNIRKSQELHKLFTHLSYYEEFRYKGILFSLFHYPIGSWNELGHGGVNLFGHCHSKYSRVIGRQMDVGLDTNNYFPYSLNEIYEKMIKIPVVTVDHHNGENSQT